MIKISIGLCIILLGIGLLYILILLLGLIFIIFNNIFSPLLYITYNYDNYMEYSGHGFILIIILFFIIGFSYLIGNAIF